MTLQDRIDAALSAAVQAGQVPGVAAMVTDLHHTRYQGAFGVRTLGQPQAMDLDTVGWIASMTKAITAAAAMQLVERGLLELDAPASRTLPEPASVPVHDGFDAPGRPITRPPRRPVTLPPPPTPTAGLRYDICNPEVRRHQ